MKTYPDTPIGQPKPPKHPNPQGLKKGDPVGVYFKSPPELRNVIVLETTESKIFVTGGFQFWRLSGNNFWDNAIGVAYLCKPE